ncbi:MAG: tetratricopeptide repeat protein, partial [Myxococcaceae bacterium]
AAECAGEEPLEKKRELVNARMKARDPAGAAACALAALKPAIDAERMLGHARFLTGDTDGALTTLERVLQLAPDDGEALYAHATVLFEAKPDDVKALAQAKAEWEQFLKSEPTSPRVAWTRRMIARADQAIAAGGVSALDKKQVAGAQAKVASAPPSMAPPFAAPMQAAPMQAGSASPPPLTREAMEAFQNTQITPEMLERFAKLIDEGEVHLASGRFQEALENYKQVMPYQPDNARLRAGMAWALVALKRQPMADRVWQVAVTSNPEAVDALGQTLKARGDAAGARSVWTKLAETAPSYAQKAGLKARLEK